MMSGAGNTMAKNTAFLYFRMALVIIVGLYTARVILGVLGVEDYGIYNVAGSVVAMFGFLNGALAISSSRFITVELGKNNKDLSYLKRCYTTTKGIHAILSILIVIVSETIGLWLLYNKCEIPQARMSAALWVYHLSVITSVITINQVPYNALVIAHEHMTIYAYLGIAEAVLKLAICFLITVSPIEKLVFYAILMLIIHVLIYVVYIIYCRKLFEECIWGYNLDRSFFRPILGFTGWNLLGSFSSMAMAQGANVMISFFFGPAIVAARAISSQIRGHLMSFVNNFRTAVNPQVLKRHAAGNVDESKGLLLFSTNVSVYLMLLITVPLLLETDYILRIWLKVVPEYAVEFTRITLLEVLFAVYDLSFYMIFQATGRLKENALICPIMDIIAFIVVYIVYKLGGGVLFIGWTLLALSILQGMLVKPFLAVRLFGYKWADFLHIYYRNFIVIIVAFAGSFVIQCLLNGESIWSHILILFSSLLYTVAVVYLIGFRQLEKERIKAILLNIIKKS